jgi:hypothetical protein
MKFCCINASAQGILVEGSEQISSGLRQGHCKEGSGQNVSFLVLTVSTDGELSICNLSNETTQDNISEASWLYNLCHGNHKSDIHVSFVVTEL